MRSLSLSSPLACLFALSFATALVAQPTGAPPASARVTVADYLEWEDVADPQLSPDGRQIAFTRRSVDKVNDKWDTGVWLMNADGSRQRSLISGSAPRWSPDGTKLLYIATGQPSVALTRSALSALGKASAVAIAIFNPSFRNSAARSAFTSAKRSSATEYPTIHAGRNASNLAPARRSASSPRS